MRRRAMQVRLAVAVVVAGAASPLHAAPPPKAGVLLARVAGYVARFHAEFERVIGTESYEQVQRGPTGESTTRHLESEVFFFRPARTGGALTVRHVQRVDGLVVTDVGDAISQALALPADARVARLRALADAGARYNLGALTRNFNEPTLATLVAAAEYQPRFRFRLVGSEVDGDRTLRRVSFDERQRPTMIRDTRGASLPMSGMLWVDDGGSIWRSELTVSGVQHSTVRIRVRYRYDHRLAMLVPDVMDEESGYPSPDRRQRLHLTGRATYSDFQRFETTARILTPRG